MSKVKNHYHQPKSGAWIRAHKRLAIYLRDGFLCVYCGTDMHGFSPYDITLDHIKPKSKGGNNKETNLVSACKSCNSARGNKSVKEFAPGGAMARIKRNRYRVLKPFIVMAKALIANKTGDLELENK